MSMSKFEDHIEHEDVATPDKASDEVDPSALGGKDISELPRHYYRSWKFLGTTTAIALGVTMANASPPMIGTSVGFINDDIGPSPDYVWIILSFTLCQSMGFPIIGRLSDLFGRRYFFIGAYFIAFLGYLIAGRVNSVNGVIGANVLTGLGTAGILQGTTVPGELVPNDKRFLFFAAVTGVFGPFLVVSPGLARTFCVDTEQGWRWIFNVGAIITFVGLILLVFCYFPPEFRSLHRHETKMNIFKHFDYVGMLLYSGGSSSLLLGLSWGGQRYPWKSAQVIVPIVVGIVVLVALGFWAKFARLSHPFFELSTITNWNWAMLSICACVASMIYYAFNILWVQQLAILFQLSPSAAGWAACSMTGGVALGFATSGPILSTLKMSIKYQLLLCTVLLTAFIGGEAASDGSNLGRGIAFSIISSYAIGYIENICIVGAALHVDAKDIGHANGLQMSLRTVTSSLASAIFVTILSNQVIAQVPSRIIAAATKGGLSPNAALGLAQALMAGNSTAIAAIPGITPSVIAAGSQAARRGYFKSFQTVYYASIAFGALTILAAAGMKGKVMKSKMTTEVARRLRKVHDRPSTTSPHEEPELAQPKAE